MIKRKSALSRRKIEIDLTGPDGNAYFLLGYAELLSEGPGKNYDIIREEMTCGDYGHLVEVFDREFGSVVTLYR